MIDIIASTVKELRDLTGLGMMECKRALVETAGDMKAAEELLRIRSGIKASKASGRIAAEGMIGAHIATDGKSGALVEVNCETDFVSRNEDFGNFAKSLAQLVTTKNITDLEVITKSTLSDGRNTEESRKELVMRLGENISVRRCVRHTTQGRLALYLHGSKIGVIIDYTGGDEALGKDLAMHIAANKPMCVSIEQVPADLLERERLIYTAQAAESGKSADIIEKMVNGRIAKYLAEITLLGQPFVKDPEQTVEKLITKNLPRLTASQCLSWATALKKSDDFAVEVMNQISKAKGIHGN